MGPRREQRGRELRIRYRHAFPHRDQHHAHIVVFERGHGARHQFPDLGHKVDYGRIQGMAQEDRR